MISITSAVILAAWGYLMGAATVTWVHRDRKDRVSIPLDTITQCANMAVSDKRDK